MKSKMESTNGTNGTSLDDICGNDFFAQFNKKFIKYNVSLNAKHLLFSNKDQKVKLICQNIIGVHHEVSRTETDNFTLLIIYYYPVVEKPNTEIIQFRQKITIKIELGSQTRSENEELAETWRTAILLASFKHTNFSLDTLSNFSLPKRRFYVLLNPCSGRQKALKMFKKIKQILYEAEIGHKLTQTTHAGHAEELASTEDFSQFDAIVTISGDGLIYEVVNGLMNRSANPTKIGLAPLPAGSGNGFVTSLAYTYPGPSVMSKSLFALVKKIPSSDSRSVPLIRAEFNQKVRYSCLYISSGIISDTDINSETLRFLGGPVRNTLYGAAYIMRKKNYNYKLKTVYKEEEVDKTDDYLGIEIAVMPFIDEKMMLFPEVFGDVPGMYLQEIKHSISRLSLLDRWEKAEDGGRHTEVEPKEHMLNTKVTSVEVRSPDDKPILFTIDGEPIRTNFLKATELPDQLSIFY